MSKAYSLGDRGGGSGDTGRRRAAILHQINSWVRQASWEDPERAERLLVKVNETPERFISPDPDANYREEASRIYGELKAEYGLRTVDDAAREYRELEEQAAEYYEKQQSPEPAPEPELGGAAEPNEHNPSAPGAGTTAEADTLEPAGEPIDDATAEPEPVQPDPAPEPTPAPAPEPDTTPGVGHTVAQAARRAVLRAAPRGRLTGGILGSLAGAWRLAAAEYRAGVAEGSATFGARPAEEQTTFESYA